MAPTPSGTWKPPKLRELRRYLTVAGECAKAGALRLKYTGLMFEFVLSALWEIVLTLAGELLLELGFSSVGEPFRERRRAQPFLAGAGVLLIGAILGAATRLAWPGRIFPPGPVPGVSLLLSPLVTGWIMHSYGEWCDRRGLSRSFVETFWGGALFAFGMALVRFLWVAT